MNVRVTVTLKRGVLDPQGKAVSSALAGLGFDGVEDVRQGKVFDLRLAETDPDTARRKVEKMCERLLANSVIEDYTVDVG